MLKTSPDFDKTMSSLQASPFFLKVKLEELEDMLKEFTLITVGRDENDEHYKVKLINNLSHEALAELIGTSRSVLSTQMQKLKHDEVLVSEKGALAVKSIKKLIEKSNDL